MDKWKASAVSREEFASLTKGLPCLVGGDLSKRIDLLSASINCMARLIAFDELPQDLTEMILSEEFGF
jgi:hypothetical protein